jgi:hypothetical protein
LKEPTPPLLEKRCASTRSHEEGRGGEISPGVALKEVDHQEHKNKRERDFFS